MENFFNFILLLIFITILIFLFSLFYVKENYKYFLLFFSIIILTLCFDLVATGLQKFYIVYFLFPVFFVLTFYLFFKQKFLINDMEYQKQISLITGLFFIYYLLLIFRTAWISDDAYITFRVADNFVNGYGLRWNVEERVQAFTNTLFLFTFIPLYFVFRDAYFSGLILNFVFSILTILLLRKLIDSKEKFLLVISGLCFSKAYIDFSTSGLENSLTFFLLTLFLYVIFKIDESDKRYTYLFLIFSALFLNRPDAVLIIIPVILYILYKEKPTFKYIFIGLIPLFLWEIFSIIYFGFPLPNTFYAKLITGINRLELIKQGGVYFFTNFITDPVTLFIIFSGIILNIVYFKKIKNAFLTFLNAGILSYLLYLLSSGGDFMTGRFFSFLLPVLLFIIVSIIDNKKYLYGFLFIFIFLWIFSPYYSVWDLKIDNKKLIKISNQIISEREFYYPVTGLLNVLIKGKKVIDESGYAKEAKRIKNDTIQSRKTAITIAIGMFGFFAGPGVYVIDQVSLADAFTARLPVAKRWRIGHFGREWPEGYENTLRQGINLIKDDKMAKFYDKISLITKGKIFSLKRFKAIIDLNIRNDLYETR